MIIGSFLIIAIGIGLHLFLVNTAHAQEKVVAAARYAGEGSITVGIEYALLNNPRLINGMADAFSSTGMPAIKPIGEATAWGEMVKFRFSRRIRFRELDDFVKTYQNEGFTEIVIALKSHNRWGSKQINFLGGGNNPTPKNRFRTKYKKWVRSVVERYDGDGKDDMPGLLYPITYYEIGSEFSSFEPEPVGEYLDMLELAYAAAHEASPAVMVGHAAFLTTPVNLDVSDPSQYETVWANTERRDNNHGLEDQRAVLDRPDLFDFLNVHNLGDPYEIEHIVRWLQYETTEQRNYTKSVVVSDTVPTSYIGWGPATTCRGRNLGVLASPATEKDRCALAEFFTRLVRRRSKTLAWTRRFVAADHVQRTMVAAEQGIQIINLSFTVDIRIMKRRIMRAGAGISAWGGAIDMGFFTGRVRERFPLYYSITQMMGIIQGYQSITRLDFADYHVRMYELGFSNGATVWVAWRNPLGVLIHGSANNDDRTQVTVDLGVVANSVATEELSTSSSPPSRGSLAVTNGSVTLELKHAPVYLFSP